MENTKQQQIKQEEKQEKLPDTMLHELIHKSSGIYYQFQKFMYINDISSAAVAFVIGLVTKDLIMSFIDSIFIPILLSIKNGKIVQKTTTFLYKSFMGKVVYFFTHVFGNIIWSTIIWIITLVLTFFILEYFLNRTLVGLKTTIPDSKKKAFVEAWLGAKGIPFNDAIYKKFIESRNEEDFTTWMKHLQNTNT